MIYFVATPIGNLKDITYRAVEVLNSVDIIACEDTRTSKVLLNHYSITQPKLISFHKFNEQETSEKIIEFAESGKNVAIISDAGMPLISDPGNCLTKKLVERNVEFTVIPGANAGLSALVLSGLDCGQFYFAGFLPEKNSEKKEFLTNASLINSTVVFYVSPHNLKKDLADVYSAFGTRKASLVKEITKIHEKTYNFTLGDKLAFSANEEGLLIEPRGEFVLVVAAPSKESQQNLLNSTIVDHVKFYINLGLSKNDAIKKVAKERNVNKNTVYQEVLKI